MVTCNRIGFALVRGSGAEQLTASVTLPMETINLPPNEGHKMTKLLYVRSDGSMVRFAKAGELDALVQGEHPGVVMDIDETKRKFVELVGDDRDRTFLMPEVAEIAGLSMSAAYAWLARDLLRPTVQGASGQGRQCVFSWTDAFVAGVLGSLNRFGIPHSVLRAIASELHHSVKKRTAIKARIERYADN